MHLRSDEEITRLRQRLREMTESGCQPHEHPAMLTRISRELPNTILVLETARGPASFTCGMHAFGFEGRPEYKGVAGHGLGLVFAGAEFLDWFAASGRLVEIGDHEAYENDVVMYFDGGHARHVGRVLSSGRVVSKWGLGLLYEHGLSEVPTHYGDQVRFFRSIEPDVALKHFLDFAKEKGVTL
jgi:hypothetical protein